MGTAKTSTEMKLNLLTKSLAKWGLAFLIVLIVYSAPTLSQAYYGDSCGQYGIMAYESGGYCQCTAGYVFGTDFLGKKTCVSASSVCTDKYGYSSRYDSLSNSCECNYGYSFHNQYGKTQCVSNNSICSDELGVMSTYDSLSDSCKCMSGYVISGGQCTSGNTVCHAKHGFYSSYKSYSNSCECDYGYTLDENNQCVQKQNNVYFKLLDVDTNDRRAIIKSDYDSRQYLVTYGSGCYSSSMERSKNRRIVVNLGTDFEVDSWDKIVLPDDDEVCDITRRERTYEDSLETEEDSYYVPAPTFIYTPPPTSVIKPTVTAASAPEKPIFTFTESPLDPPQQAMSVAKSNVRKCPSTQECVIVRTLKEASTLLVTATSGDWYKVSKISGTEAQGWINKSVITFENQATADSVNDGSSKDSVPGKNSIWSRFRNWFKW